MLGAHVLGDFEASDVSKSLDLSTTWGHRTFTEKIQTPSSDIKQLKKQQLPLLALRNPEVAGELSILRSEVKNVIAPNTPIVDELNTSIDPRIKESIQQILWSPSALFSFLNTQPLVVSGLVAWKTIALPGISILMPLLAVILPFFFLRFFHGSEKVTAADYLTHVRSVVLRQVSIPPVLRAKHGGDRMGYILESLFVGITLATFISGLWNQVMLAIHLRKIAADLVERGNKLYTIIESSTRILSVLNNIPVRIRRALNDCIEEGESALQPFRDMPHGGLAGFGYIWNNTEPLKALQTWIGKIDVYTTIASTANICFPVYKTGTSLSIERVYHPALSQAGITNTADFSKKSHVLLTGPNRGGKSTFCRSVGLAVLCAQTWGFAWASRMSFDPFTAIETALSPSDELGKMSLFEAEIEFAKSVLKQCEERSNVLVMMDEIFHSTNAHDGIAASRVFLDRLYTHTSVTSLISTHYRELVEHYDKEDSVGAWAMETDEDEKGKLIYKYRVIPGISDKSSVMEILQERGLLQSRGKLAENTPFSSSRDQI